MSKFRRLFFVVAAWAVLVIVATSLVNTRSSPSRAASPTGLVSTQVQTDTAAPTLAPSPTAYIPPTNTSSPTATPTALPPSATPIPPTLTPTTTPSPLPTATATYTPLATISSTVAALTYTVTISDVYARREPNLTSSQYQPLKRGQSYTVTAQSPDGIWLSLELPQVNGMGWVPAAFGLTYGSREAVPLAGPTLTPASKPMSPTVVLTASLTVYPYLPAVGARARDVYRYGLLLGNNPHTFMKIGDCQAKYPFFLAAFDSPKNYRLGDSYAYLQETIGQFAGSFKRDSVAAQTGFGTATVLDPQWANPLACRPGESPLVCEYRTMLPSLAIISLGTNDIWQPDGRHEKNIRQIIEYLIHRGVLPILSTKADNVEGDGSFNLLMVQLATEYQLPLWDFWLATRSLPQNGLMDIYHLSWGPAIFDDPANMQLGWPWRNLTALQALDAVWRSVR